MKLQSTNNTNGTRTIRNNANDMTDGELFAFTAKLAPKLTVIYNKGNDTKDAGNLVCFVGDYDQCRAFVRSEFVSYVYDARLAVLLAATEYFLASQAMTAYANANNGETLDVKSARAIAKTKLPTAYKNVIDRAIAADLFTQDSDMHAIARAYADGKFDCAPFAQQAGHIEMPYVTVRGVIIVDSKRGANVRAIPTVDIDVDGALESQFTVDQPDVITQFLADVDAGKRSIFADTAN